MASQSRVYILGAGCSFDAQHGYPVAKHFIPELTRYRDSLEHEKPCERIKRSVDETIRLLTACQSGSCHASTIDQLINLILTGSCDGILNNSGADFPAQRVGLRYAAVRNAKIATAACFLQKEADVISTQVPKYRSFIQEHIFNETGISTPCHFRLSNSTARVLSFNYDRLFELGFFASVTDSYARNFFTYSAELLNSSFDVSGDISPIVPNRFCFLKMHGSVGMICEDDAFGQRAREFFDVSRWKSEKVTDAILFPSSLRGEAVPQPLIVFPYEKDFIVQGRSNQLPFRLYIETVWGHASQILSQATEIWVIGYSFDPTDSRWLIQQLRGATKCERLVIQNLPSECDRLENLLRVRHNIPIKLVKYPFPF